jgi:hypothetical protein
VVEWRCSECRTPVRVGCDCARRHRLSGLVFVWGLAALVAVMAARCVWLLLNGPLE